MAFLFSSSMALPARVCVGYLYTHSDYVLSKSAIKVAFSSVRFQSACG